MQYTDKHNGDNNKDHGKHDERNNDNYYGGDNFDDGRADYDDGDYYE